VRPLQLSVLQSCPHWQAVFMYLYLLLAVLSAGLTANASQQVASVEILSCGG